MAPPAPPPDSPPEVPSDPAVIAELRAQNALLLARNATLLARIAGTATMQVNSSHHQAVKSPGRFAVVNATAPDGVIEGIEDPRYGFALGVQWHPEFLIDPADRRIFEALVAAASG